MSAQSIIDSLYEGLRHLMNMVICLIALLLHLLYNTKSSISQLKGTFKTIIEHYKEVSLQTGKASLNKNGI